ncbi:MAG TPA: SIS domain-containing protein, partial [Thermoflexales bacterium]|nr:SIS domain-containing protein [Thermoflexales bacterium]
MIEHSQAYIADLTAALQKLDHAAIGAATAMLMDAWREERSIYLFGNGGSAATASHMMTDLNMIDTRGMTRFRAIALTDNVPLMTAWSNDTGYENAFVEPLLNFCKPGDVCIAISCSGNSKNVLRAVEAAKKIGAKIIAFTGDTGGQLAPLADVCVHAPHPFIGAQEDIHLVLDHLITQSLRNWIARVAELNARELKALVLAAGEGTRLRPLTLDKPKPMIPVNGKPVLQHILEWLVS